MVINSIPLKMIVSGYLNPKWCGSPFECHHVVPIMDFGIKSWNLIKIEKVLASGYLMETNFEAFNLFPSHIIG